MTQMLLPNTSDGETESKLDNYLEALKIYQVFPMKEELYN
jgi:hypothetical protein